MYRSHGTAAMWHAVRVGRRKDALGLACFWLVNCFKQSSISLAHVVTRSLSDTLILFVIRIFNVSGHCVIVCLALSGCTMHVSSEDIHFF